MKFLGEKDVNENSHVKEKRKERGRLSRESCHNFFEV